MKKLFLLSTMLLFGCTHFGSTSLFPKKGDGVITKIDQDIQQNKNVKLLIEITSDKK